MFNWIADRKKFSPDLCFFRYLAKRKLKGGEYSVLQGKSCDTSEFFCIEKFLYISIGHRSKNF